MLISIIRKDPKAREASAIALKLVAGIQRSILLDGVNGDTTRDEGGNEVVINDEVRAQITQEIADLEKLIAELS